MQIPVQLHEMITEFLGVMGIHQASASLNLSMDQLADLAVGDRPSGVNLNELTNKITKIITALTGPRPGENMNAKSKWKKVVQGYRSGGLTQPQAVAKANRTHPQLRAALVAESNPLQDPSTNMEAADNEPMMAMTPEMEARIGEMMDEKLAALGLKAERENYREKLAAEKNRLTALYSKRWSADKILMQANRNLETQRNRLVALANR